MKARENTCYMCSAQSSGNEHVPPKCLFPEKKDLELGQDYRKNLLSVPSCDAHNSKKSSDDVYFLYVLGGSEQINQIGLHHYNTKIRRANKRNNSLLKKLAENALEINGKIAHSVDMNRLNSFVHHLAKALYYSHYSTKWEGEIGWFPEFMSRFPDNDAELQRLVAIQNFDTEFKAAEFCGENPEVFKYQVIQKNELIKMRLHFYEGCKIILAYGEE